MVFPAEEAASQGHPVGGEHVLVVDDNPSVLAMLGRILDAAGYHTTQATNGLEALQKVEAEPEAFNAVVTDIVMPDLDGVELRERLADVRPSLPVVLLSAYPPPELHTSGLRAPCAILRKPVPPEALVETVRNCIAGRMPPKL
jgi:CheY-like chemotaxis protein